MSKIELPAEPVDLYEITGWIADDRGVTEMRWRFHINRSCEEVLGYHGAPWVDDWEVLRNGNCQGRICGWQEILKYIDERCFFDLSLAQVEARRLVQQRADSLRGQLAELERQNPWLVP